MAGYWPSSFFACLWTETKSRSINSQKKNNIHLDRTNLVNKGFIIWLSGKFFMRDTAGSPERARWLHLARQGSQSQRAIWFILPARGASHIIMSFIEALFRLSHFTTCFVSGNLAKGAELLLCTLAPRQHNRDFCCAASVASKQQYKQDLRKIYRRGDEFSN